MKQKIQKLFAQAPDETRQFYKEATGSVSPALAFGIAFGVILGCGIAVGTSPFLDKRNAHSVMEEPATRPTAQDSGSFHIESRPQPAYLQSTA